MRPRLRAHASVTTPQSASLTWSSTIKASSSYQRGCKCSISRSSISGGSRRAVLDVEPIQFARRLAGDAKHRLGVGRRAPARGRQNRDRVHGRHSRQSLSQLVTFAVVANHRNGNDSADAERHQVIDDRAGRTGIRAHADDLVGVLPGFDGGLGQRRVDVEVAVEKQVAEDADRQSRQAVQDAFDGLYR